MATASLDDVFSVPVRLVLNPAAGSIGIAAPSHPYGGTALGLVKSVDWDWGYRYEPHVSQEHGEQAGTVRKGKRPRLAFILSQWDSDALSAIFPSVTTSSSPSGVGGIRRINGTDRPGLVTAMNPLLVAPFDDNHPALLIHRPIPVVIGSMRFTPDSPAVFVLGVDVTRDSNGLTFQVDRVEHLGLS